MNNYATETNIKKAIALQYDSEKKSSAPKVIASGKSHLAEQIIMKAKSFNIPIFENKELADTLLNIEVEQEIPAELYKAVSEVFVWLMKQNK